VDKISRINVTGGAPSTGPYANQHGCWGYDSFGNRTVSTVGTASCTTTATATYSSNNQITWLQNLGTPGYAPAGNVASDSLNQYLYDNENRVCAVRNLLTNAMTGYLYDGDGERVAKGVVANLSACPAVQGFSSITAQYLLGPNSEQVTELNGSGAWQHSNVFAAGRLLATYNTLGLHFQFTDWLGTKRTQTTAAGVSEEQCQSLPFGDGLSCSGGPGVDATEHHFTGRERDVESGNDFFLARYYNSTTGRFLTPDWSLKAEPVPYANLGLPQTLNLYAYVGNNPLTHTDVDGHMPYTPCASDPLCNPEADQKSDSEISAEKTEAKSADDTRKALQQGVGAPGLHHRGDPGTGHISPCDGRCEPPQCDLMCQLRLWMHLGQLKQPNRAPSNSTQKPGFWNYVRNGTFCTDTVNAAEKAGWIGGGIFVVGTGLDATGIAIPAGVAMQAYGVDVMAVSTSIGATAQLGKALGVCH
jgi:RHS repeat-associated protein